MNQREELLAALETSDAARRGQRADRIEWLGLHRRRPAAFAGRPETLRLLSEAEDTYVDGHFVASLVLAVAFIEHTLKEELEVVGEKARGLMAATAKARQLDMFPTDWLDGVDALRLKRNPFAHLQEPEDQNTLGQRYRKLKMHPEALLQSDAQDALALMNDFFIATLRQVTSFAPPSEKAEE